MAGMRNKLGAWVMVAAGALMPAVAGALVPALRVVAAAADEEQHTAAAAAGEDLPVAAPDRDLPVLAPDLPLVEAGVRNQVTIEQIRGFTGPQKEGLAIDLKDPALQGRIFTGPYPFEAGEADYDYFRYRLSAELKDGRGTLPIAGHFTDRYNANDWPAGLFPSTPALAYRLDLWRLEGGAVRHHGFYDSLVSFRREAGGFVRNLTIVEGPFVALLRSDDPASLVIAWETDAACRGKVFVVKHGDRRLLRAAAAGEAAPEGVMEFSGAKEAARHQIMISGLLASTEYAYVAAGSTAGGERAVSPCYTFRTAPPAGEGSAVIAYVGDSREGVGGGESNYMGVNYAVLSRLANDAFRRGADLFIFGGDLVNGYTSSADDFRLQLRAWKQAMAGFWRCRPVYPGMGNHETLLNIYRGPDGRSVLLDKWPYAEASAEALFAAEFFNPGNGPEPSDQRRPPYAESVFTLQYGPVRVIAFNNNYWYSSHPAEHGGAPEGYIFEDQLEWIEAELARAEADPAVRHVVLFAQEPVFPCGGHLGDAMWYRGDNNVRAFVVRDGAPEAETFGMIEVRNRLWRAVSRNKKAAAVLTSDEHEYHRTLITNETPVGVFPADDHDGDGVLDAYSPDPGFGAPVWHITAGTGGAPYYAREATPWEPACLSSQPGYALIRADAESISFEFITITGQVLDHIQN